MVILPCFRSTSVRCRWPISEARSPWRYASRKSALSRLSLITPNRRLSSSCVRNCSVPEPRRVLGLEDLDLEDVLEDFDVAIYQTEYLFCLILSIHSDVSTRKPAR